MRQMLCTAVAVSEIQQVLRPYAGPDLVFSRVLGKDGAPVDVPFEVGQTYVIEIRRGDLGRIGDGAEALAKLACAG